MYVVMTVHLEGIPLNLVEQKTKKFNMEIPLLLYQDNFFHLWDRYEETLILDE